ncbi:hypothetical protein [Pseudogemmobacter bohemicus]|uniref:hypothetical protein n=1 Tax=Pseudogemmobacter bohemicus TaxID=2250708 RepID=UPI0013006533|nr:hypothetical protein [Pseudogemmobacter bohemicus]
MTEIGLALCLLALAPLPLPHLYPLHAQSAPDSSEREAETEKGFSLIEEGAKLLLRGLMNEMEPSIAELEGALREIAPEIEAHIDALGPQLSELAKLMQDVKNYDMPVMLENGDILIRRKLPLPPEGREGGRDGETAPERPAPRGPPPAPGPNGEIEL